LSSRASLIVTQATNPICRGRLDAKPRPSDHKLNAQPNLDNDRRQHNAASLVFIATILLVIVAFAFLAVGSGSPTAQSPSSSSSIGGASSVTNSSGADICCHFVGSDPVPVGCETPLGAPTLNEGYSLQVYASSRTVNANGDALCITLVLQNVHGTIVTFATREGRVSISYNVTDPSGKVVYRNDCSIYTSPPTFAPSYNETDRTFGCTTVWYTTGSAPGGGVSPTTSSTLQPGTYVVSCTASFPGLGGLDTKARASANATLTASSP